MGEQQWQRALDAQIETTARVYVIGCRRGQAADLPRLHGADTTVGTLAQYARHERAFVRQGDTNE